MRRKKHEKCIFFEGMSWYLKWWQYSDILSYYCNIIDTQPCNSQLYIESLIFSLCVSQFHHSGHMRLKWKHHISLCKCVLLCYALDGMTAVCQPVRWVVREDCSSNSKFNSLNSMNKSQMKSLLTTTVHVASRPWSGPWGWSSYGDPTPDFLIFNKNSISFHMH